MRAHGGPGAGKTLANWIQTELLRELHRDQRPLAECPIQPASLAALVRLIDDGTISGKIAKDVFARMYATGDEPGAIVEREGLVQVTDLGAIEAAARDVLAANPKFEVLAANSLGKGESTNSSLVISDGDIFIRTFRHLWCIGKKE